MKPQATGLLLCTLLMSTFGHELLARQRVAHSLRDQTQLTQTNKPGEVCFPVCSCSSGSGGLKVTLNETTGTIAITNSTASVTLIIDVTAGIVGIFDDTSGGLIIIKLSTNTIIHIDGASSSAVWNNDVKALFQTSLTVIFERAEKHGQKVDINSISAELSAKILAGLTALGAVGGTADGKEGLQYLTFLALGYSEFVKIGVLKVIINVTAVQNVPLLIAVFQAIALLSGEIEGGISVFVKNKIKLDFSILANVKNAIDAFIYILIQTHKYIHFKNSSSHNFFLFLSELGGNSTTGINGLISIVATIEGLVNHSNNIIDVIIVLLRFGGSQSNYVSLSKEWSAAIQRLLSILEQLNLNASLEGVVTVLKAIQRKTWIVEKVNISAIIERLVNLNSPALSVIVSILIELETVVAIKISILILIAGLVRLLVSAAGRDVLSGLLGITIDGSALEKIKADILKKLSGNINSSNILNLLQSLPVLGAAFKVLVTALTHVHLDLLVIIQEFGIGQFVDLVRGVLTLKVISWSDVIQYGESSTGPVTFPPE